MHFFGNIHLIHLPILKPVMITNFLIFLGYSRTMQLNIRFNYTAIRVNVFQLSH